MSKLEDNIAYENKDPKYVIEIPTGVWGYMIYKHKNGNLRYAVWDDADGEVCWCRTLERAQEICEALGGING